MPVFLASRAAGSELWTVGSDDRVRRVSTADGRVLASFAVPGAGRAVVACDRDSQSLYLRCLSGELMCFDGSGRVDPTSRTGELPALAKNGARALLAALATPSGALAFGPYERPLVAGSLDGRRLAVANEVGGLRILDAEDGSLLLTLSNRGSPHQAFAWAGSGDVLFATLRSGYTLVWTSRPRSEEPLPSTRSADSYQGFECLREAGVATPTAEVVRQTSGSVDLPAETKARALAVLARRAPEPQRFLHEARRHLLSIDESDEVIAPGRLAARAAAAGRPGSSLAHAYVALGALRAGDPSEARSAIANARAALGQDPLGPHPLLPAVEAWLATKEERFDDAKERLDEALRQNDRPGFRHDRLLGAVLAMIGVELDRARH